MLNIQRAKIITIKQLPELRHSLPESWLKAKGLLKGKKAKSAKLHIKKIRREWESRSVASRFAAEIRRTVKMKFPDAAIAATALYTRTPLVTRNQKDFKNVPTLSIVAL